MRSRLLIAALLLASAAAAQAPKRPNIVLFLVDDLGWQDISVPLHSEATPFNRRYRTPNVARLAAEGMRFTDAYASAPVCTPTRTSIMTGKSPARSRITYWTFGRDRDTSKKRDDVAAPAWRMNGLAEADVTLPGLLRGAGYRTIHVGKAHFGAHDTPGGDPARLGFDVNVAGHASGAPGSYYGKHAFTAAGRQGKKPKSSRSRWDVPGLEPWHGKDVYLTEVLAGRACDEVRRAVKDGKRFYLNMAPYAVHTPIMANPRHLSHYEGLDPREAAYATMIESVDRALGEILTTLDELKIRDETLVVFASDNGGLSAHARGGEPNVHNAPLKSGKGSAYEGGTRVPMIVRWPGRVKPKTVSSLPVVTHDLFPTFLAAAHVAIPKAHASELDGLDLSPLLAGDRDAIDAERVILWNMPHQWGAKGPGIRPFTSIRRGRWKLIWFHPDRRFELYDLRADNGETTDLAEAEPERVRELAAVMSRELEHTGAQLSIDRATGKPIPGPAAEAK